jgi:biotin carboxylase
LKRTILILGAGVMQGPALRAARELGLRVCAADGNPSAPNSGMADRFFPVDLRDLEGLCAAAAEIESSGGLHAVFTAGTDFSASVAYVAERFSLPGIPYQTALDASDKSRMRQRFAEGGAPTPRFAVATEEAQALEAAARMGLPLVVKPVDNMGARGCRLARDRAELAEAFADARDNSRSGRVIVEEYLDGPEYSIDALVWDGRLEVTGFADRHIFFPPYFIEMGHTMPTEADDSMRAEVLGAFAKGVAALGIARGAAKGDIKLVRDSGGFWRGMIGEIAARLSGGYMSGWTYPYSSGVDLAKEAIRISLGESPLSLSPKLSLVSAERAWISIPGIVAELRGVEEAGRLPLVRDVFLRSREGDRLRFPRNNVEKCGNVIAVGPDRASAVLAASRAAASVLIRLRPGESETDAFLSRGGEAFPDAFSPLSSADWDQIEAMPPLLRGAELLGGIAKGGMAKDKMAPGLGARGPGSIEIGLSPPPDCLLGARDFAGRSLDEALGAVEALCGVRVDGGAPIVLGSLFWSAFARGSYQGGAYVIDSLRAGRGGLS